MKFFRSTALALAFAAALPALAFAQSTVLDQVPGPVPSTSNSAALNSELLLQSYPITGGTLYTNCWRAPGRSGGTSPILSGCSGPAFVATNLSGAYTRNLSLTDARFDSGITGAASGASGTGFNIARTAGTSYSLTGVATSSSAVTTKVMWETNVASTYASGTAIPVVVNANYTGSGTITGASTTLTVAAYTEIGGVETALTGITAAQPFTGTAAAYTFNIPSTAGLAAGQHITIEVTMLVTSASGANTGQINGIGVTD